MFCKYCGNEITDDSVFCYKCGKKVKAENTDSGFEGEIIANGNETADKQDGAPTEEDAKLGSDSPAKEAAACEDSSDGQDSAPREEEAEPVSGSPGKAAAAETDAANKQERASIDEVVKETVDSMNPFCGVGLILTVIMIFSNPYGIVGLAAILFSFFGYKAARKNGERGTTLAIVCMAVAGVISLVFVACLIDCLVEYRRYESAVYGGIGGLLDLLGDL